MTLDTLRDGTRDQVLRGVCALVLGALMLLAMADSAQAQRRVARAELKRVTGRVEILRKGQTQWVPAVAGARLAEGDDIRAFSGASAELELPDTSTLLVAENSRVVVTKLEFDLQKRTRFAFFHLAVGKVRAVIAQAAITLVRARQSNFAISTPTAVAAARGTIVTLAFSPGAAPGVPGQTLVAVTPRLKKGVSVVDCIPLEALTGLPVPRRVQRVRENEFTDCQKPARSLDELLKFRPLFLTDFNPVTPGAQLILVAPGGTVTPPPTQIQVIIQTITAPPPPPLLTVTPPVTPVAAEPSPEGQNIIIPEEVVQPARHDGQL